MCNYKIYPRVIDQSLLIICRQELYLLILSQSQNIFIYYSLEKIFDSTSVTDAKATLLEDKKTILFSCSLYENPIVIGRF